MEKGQATAKQCQACHTFEKGGPNRVGPNLWGIVGDERGEGRGFNFSAAMKAKGGNWTFDELYKFLTDPRGYIPGTAMTFAGLKREQQRADVIDYLHTWQTTPRRCRRRRKLLRLRGARRRRAGRAGSAGVCSGPAAGEVIATSVRS